MNMRIIQKGKENEGSLGINYFSPVRQHIIYREKFF